MTFFHLADLHIGKMVNGFSMLRDQTHVLDQICRHAEAERPDAVLIAGDVYDKPVPNVEGVRLLDDFLSCLIHLGIRVLVISGNHDSPERLSFASSIMAEKGLYVSAPFQRKVQKVTLEDPFGPVVFYLLPFLRPSMVRSYFPEINMDSTQDAVAAVLGETAPPEGERNVLVAHQFVASAGEEPVRSDSEIMSLGGTERMDSALLQSFDYVALGHLHGSQRVGEEHIRYAGSPLPYSFSEVHQKKSFVMVEMSGNGSLDISQVPLEPLHEMRMIKGPIDRLVSPEVVAMGDPMDYLHVTLTDEEEPWDAIGRLRSAYPNLMGMAFDNTRSRWEGEGSWDDPQEVKSVPELFAEFYREQNGQPLSQHQEKQMEAYWEEGGALG